MIISIIIKFVWINYIGSSDTFYQKKINTSYPKIIVK